MPASPRPRLKLIVCALAAVLWPAVPARAADAPSAADPAPANEAAAPAGAVVSATRWDGLAASLAARGLRTSTSLTGLWIGDVAGGQRTGGVYNTLGFVGLDADLAKLTGAWRGGHAFVNAAWIRGGSVSAAFVGDALVASNLDGFPGVRLYDAWLEQQFSGGRASVRVGAMGADEEFSGTDGGGMLTNSGFGWEAGIGANVVNGGPIYFAPALGVRVALDGPQGWSLRAGAYDGDSFDSPDGDPAVNAHGLRFGLSRAQGAFLIGECGRGWGTGEALPGTLRLGAWRHTADFADDLRDGRGASFALSGLEPAVHHGNHGAYGSFEQKLWNEPRDAEQGLGAWLRVAGAPADRSRYPWVSEGGVRWIGPLPARDSDALGLGVVTARVSPDLQQHVRDVGALAGGQGAVPDFERVIEAAYQVRIGARWSVTPDVQWVQHPGTTHATPDAVVAGLRVSRQ